MDGELGVVAPSNGAAASPPRQSPQRAADEAEGRRMSEFPFRLRQAEESDHALILDSWVKSYTFEAIPKVRDVGDAARIAMAAEARQDFLKEDAARTAARWALEKRYKRAFRLAATAALARSQAVVVAAETDLDTVLAWVVYEVTPLAKVVHYAYTKQEVRRMGVARYLFKATLLCPGLEPNCGAVAYTHRTQPGEGLREAMGIKHYQPELFVPK